MIKVDFYHAKPQQGKEKMYLSFTLTILLKWGLHCVQIYSSSFKISIKTEKL